MTEESKKPANGSMADEAFETVEPIGKRVVIRKDEDKKETKGGIRLPDNIEIPTIPGRIVAVSAEVESDPMIPLKRYDKRRSQPLHWRPRRWASFLEQRVFLPQALPLHKHSLPGCGY